MAVINELIEAGLRLKQQGNYQAAIEHFRQLNATYPHHARIMFELADAWRALGVPEQAVPLYRQLIAIPKHQGLPLRDVPRLYTQTGASLRLLGEYRESLAVIEEGLRRYPAYRPLRAYRLFALHSAGLHQNAMVESLELMLESLGPSKWDTFEEDIIHIVKGLREQISQADTAQLEDWEFDEYWTETESDQPDEPVNAAKSAEDDRIGVMDEDELDFEGLELEVKVRPSPAKPQPKPRQTDSQGQFGRKPVQIDISFDGEEDEDKPSSDDDSPPPASGRVSIPIDFD